MTRTPDNDRTREIGIDFGSLAQTLEEHEYPATNDDLVAAYGESVFLLQNGEQMLRDIFESMATESFDSSEDARQAIFSCVDEQAIERKGYSDRTPPALGEDPEHPSESF